MPERSIMAITELDMLSGELRNEKQMLTTSIIASSGATI